MYYPLDYYVDPSVFVLEDGDRFHAISHSCEIPLPDGTTMILVIFVVRRTSGNYDMFITNKFFRPGGDVSRTLMSKKGIPPADVEQVLVTTAATFARTLQAAKIRWDELDLRKIEGKGGQIAAIKKWGRLTNVRIDKD
jgi:hypothetical protein